MAGKRRNIEEEMIKEFRKAAKEYTKDIFSGQGKNNRIEVGDNIYFQFGDLRVETGNCSVIVEVESSGGVTNLVKYWYILSSSETEPKISKDIILLHIFKKNSENDYESHIKLWEFLYGKMKEKLGNRIEAKLFEVKNEDDLSNAVNKFKKKLKKLSEV
ncbi:MAG: hypothetical protein K6357_08195 [Elusimicrobiota bacterium]